MDPIEVDPGTVARVRGAIASVDRAGFLPADVRAYAGQDRPLPIGWSATNSQPSTVARMLELLEVQDGHRVLDVGAGSGWTCWLLDRLVGDGEVIGVERVPELVAVATANLRAHGCPVVVEHAIAGTLGLPDRAPFDRVLVSADLGREPTSLVEQLGPGGTLVAPIGGTMTVIDRSAGGIRRRVDRGRYAFVPLVEG